jgi:predicted nucleic acid-binding Zn ribbon protein
MPLAAAIDASTCPRCGAPVPRGPRFCGACGADVLGLEVEEQERRRRAPYLAAGAVVAVALLLVALVLSVYKPRGVTRRGRRAQRGRRA